MDGITWKQCEQCDGSGEAAGLLPGVTYTCSGCGGHAVRPAGGRGTAAFYRSDGGGRNQQIALLHRGQDDAGLWRVSIFDQKGPRTHEERPAGRIMDALRGFQRADAAANLLDYWSTRPAWRLGLQQMEYTAYCNLFYYHQQAETVHRMRRIANAAGLGMALHFAEQERRRLLPESDLF